MPKYITLDCGDGDFIAAEEIEGVVAWADDDLGCIIPPGTKSLVMSKSGLQYYSIMTPHQIKEQLNGK